MELFPNFPFLVDIGRRESLISFGREGNVDVARRCFLESAGRRTLSLWMEIREKGLKNASKTWYWAEFFIGYVFPSFFIKST